LEKHFVAKKLPFAKQQTPFAKGKNFSPFLRHILHEELKGKWNKGSRWE